MNDLKNVSQSSGGKKLGKIRFCFIHNLPVCLFFRQIFSFEGLTLQIRVTQRDLMMAHWLCEKFAGSLLSKRVNQLASFPKVPIRTPQHQKKMTTKAQQNQQTRSFHS